MEIYPLYRFANTDTQRRDGLRCLSPDLGIFRRLGILGCRLALLELGTSQNKSKIFVIVTLCTCSFFDPFQLQQFSRGGDTYSRRKLLNLPEFRLISINVGAQSALAMAGMFA